MSITDELRSWAEGDSLRAGMSLRTARDQALAIADRIDAEHESACAEAYGNGVMSVPIALDESAWVELPKDADGKPIHVGDVMEWCDSGDTLEVIGIGDNTLFYVDPEGDRTYAEWTAARNKRHYHAPTVEDVLREFTDAILEWSGKSGTVAEVGTWSDVAAEYAAKLRLAKEDA